VFASDTLGCCDDSAEQRLGVTVLEIGVLPEGGLAAARSIGIRQETVAWDSRRA